MNKAKQLFNIYVLNVFLLAIYFTVSSDLNLTISDEIMFIAPDAKEYLVESTNFYDVSKIEFSNRRTFFYPLFLLIIYHTSGAIGTWAAQFLLWSASINLLYLAIKRFTGNSVLAFTGGLLMALNFSLIALTFHALSEVITVFFVSLLLYFVSANIKEARSLRFIHGSLFILSVLALIKPLFYLPLLFTLFVPLPICYFKEYRKYPKKLILLVLVLVPLLFQLTMMKIKYDKLTVSEVSSMALREYIISQGIQENEHISWEEAQEISKNLSDRELMSFIMENKRTLARFYFENLKGNVFGSPTYLLWPKEHPGFSNFMLKMNTYTCYLHLFFLTPVFLAFYITYRQKRTRYLILLLIPFLLAAYIIFTSGISFMQGDRLLIPSIPLWIFLYLLVINLVQKNVSMLRQR